MSLWTDQSAAAATKGTATGIWKAQRVVIDSRAVKQGDLFVALKGERVDGHHYVKDALRKGAVAAVVSVESSGAQLLVPDTLKALADLGRAARTRSSAQIVGVTGSVGKTSTREMIRLSLAAHGETFATSGNYNNHIGTPLMLSNFPESAKFGVFEMGMNHAGEITPLSKMVRPHVAVITNIEAVHLEFFDSLEGIADAKAEIFEGVEKNGVAILNADNAQFTRLTTAAQKHGLTVIACGEHKDANVRLISYQATSHDRIDVTAMVDGRQVQYHVGAIGKHWAILSLFALAASKALGLDVAKSATALADFKEVEGRGGIVPLANGALLIDDSYNASPASMRAAFTKTAELWKIRGKKGRKIAALGDMLELGESAPSLHKTLADALQEAGFDAVFTAGDHMKHLFSTLPPGMGAAHAEHVEHLIPLLLKALRQDDILLVKGSHGSHMYEVTAMLKGE